MQPTCIDEHLATLKRRYGGRLLREAAARRAHLDYRSISMGDGRGTARPGTIALRDASGRVYGPWQATGSPGQGGVANAMWTARPMATLPAGRYTVIDSDPSTWSQNSATHGAGITRVEGH